MKTSRGGDAVAPLLQDKVFILREAPVLPGEDGRNAGQGDFLLRPLPAVERIVLQATPLFCKPVGDLVVENPRENLGVAVCKLDRVANQLRRIGVRTFEEKVAFEVLWITFHGVPLDVFLRFFWNFCKIYSKGTFFHAHARARVGFFCGFFAVFLKKRKFTFLDTLYLRMVQMPLDSLKDDITLSVKIFPGTIADDPKVASKQFFIHAELLRDTRLDLAVCPAAL